MKPINFKKPLLALSTAAVMAASLGFSTSVLADPEEGTGLTLSAAYGGYKSRGGEFEDENDLYEVALGYRFLPFFGIELGYTDLGDFGGDVASAEVDGYSVSALGIIPLTESFKLYGEVGQFHSDMDVEVLGFDDSFEDESLFYGVGVSFRISDPIWVNAEYQRYNVEVDDEGWPVEVDDEDTDIDAVKVGLLVNF